MASLGTISSSPNDLDRFLNKRSIIIGEVGCGKTYYTELILKKILESGHSPVAVLDMAPESKNGIGGKMNMVSLEGVRYYTTSIHAPRLTGRSPHEVELLAKENASRIEQLFDIFRNDPARTLCINDVSIYLQAGDLERLWAIVNMSLTVILNGYYGTSLGGGKLAERERRNMEALSHRCDRIIKVS